MMNLLTPLDEMPLDAMPLIELTPQFVASLRDRIAAKHGRRQANYVIAVVSLAYVSTARSTASFVKRVRRSRSAPKANRPWTMKERRNVLAHLRERLKLPVALAMFTGLRKGDVLALTKSAIRRNDEWHAVD